MHVAAAELKESRLAASRQQHARLQLAHAHATAERKAHDTSARRAIEAAAARGQRTAATQAARRRKAVAERIGAEHSVSSNPGYIHHSTFAYQLYPITSNEAAAAWEAYNEAAAWMLASVPPFTLTRPDLCTFRDMGEFLPVPGDPVSQLP